MQEIIRLGTQCNENCIFCNVISGYRELTTKEAMHAISESSKKNPEVISFTGGEPTLRNDLFKLIAYAKACCPAAEVELQTNALRCSYPHYVSGLTKAGLDSVFVSFHSHKKNVFEKITCRPGSYGYTVKGIENLANSTINLKINVVINSLNYSHLPEYVHFLDEKFGEKITHLSFSFVQPFGKAWKNKWIIPHYSQVESYLTQAAKYCSKKGINFNNPFCGVPLCFFKDFLEKSDEFNWKQFSANEKTDTVYNNVRKKKILAPICSNCDLNDICLGFWVWYARMYGLKEAKPVKVSDLTLACKNLPIKKSAKNIVSRSWQDAAQSFFKEGSLEDAAYCFELFLFDSPESLITFNQLGQKALDNNRFKEAVKFFRKGIGITTDLKLPSDKEIQKFKETSRNPHDCTEEFDKVTPVELFLLLHGLKDCAIIGCEKENTDSFRNKLKQNGFAFFEKRHWFVLDKINNIVENKKNTDFITLFYASYSEKTARKIFEIESKNKQYLAPSLLTESGKLLGYPSCCIDFFEKIPSREKKSLHIIESLKNTTNQPSPYLNTITSIYPLIIHCPCSLNCEKSISQAKKVLFALEKGAPNLFTKIKKFYSMPVLYFDNKRYVVFDGSAKNGIVKYTRVYSSIDFAFREKVEDFQYLFYLDIVKHFENCDTVKVDKKTINLYRKGEKNCSFNKSSQFSGILFEFGKKW